MQIIQEKFELNILKASFLFSIYSIYLENNILHSYQIKINPYFRPTHVYKHTYVSVNDLPACGRILLTLSKDEM